MKRFKGANRVIGKPTPSSRRIKSVNTFRQVSLTHTHTHAHTHARAHTHIHTHSHARTQTHSHKHMHSHTHQTTSVIKKHLFKQPNIKRSFCESWKMSNIQHLLLDPINQNKQRRSWHTGVKKIPKNSKDQEQQLSNNSHSRDITFPPPPPCSAN